jgi:hypothetical protein
MPQAYTLPASVHTTVWPMPAPTLTHLRGPMSLTMAGAGTEGWLRPVPHWPAVQGGPGGAGRAGNEYKVAGGAVLP